MAPARPVHCDLGRPICPASLHPGTEELMSACGRHSISRITLAFVVALSWMLAACGRDTAAINTPAPRIVRTATVEKRKITTPLTFSGRIEAEDEVNVAFRISGRLLKNDTKIGDQ